MKKFLILLFIPFLIGAAPSRQYTYTAGETILADEVSGNEDAIFNYLQSGIDTYRALSIENADISTTANIQSEKLNLTSIVQGVNITSSGSLTNAGTFTQTGNTTFSGANIANLGTVTTADINGGSIDGVTIGAASAPTVTNLGSVTTADINGGTLDGVNIGTETATGMLIVNNSSDDADGLGAQGTSGQYLQSAGAGANPTWATLENTSNTVFSWSGVDAGNAEYGIYSGSDQTPTGNAATQYNFLYAENSAYYTVLRFKFAKIEGLDTVTIYARTWTDTSGNEVYVNVDIGGASNSVVSDTDTTPTWQTSADVDVSGLSDGTTYDGVIQMKAEVQDSAGYCSAITLIGS